MQGNFVVAVSMEGEGPVVSDTRATLKAWNNTFSTLPILEETVDALMYRCRDVVPGAP